MKKKFNIGILLTGLLFSLGMSSCKKEWTCECTDSSGNTESYSLAYLGKIKKSQAKKVCDAFSYAGYTCKVK